MSILRFNADHEWVSTEGDEAVIGITDYAQTQLGDIAHVELPKFGRRIGQGEEVAIIESIKAASELYAPVSGEVTAVNTDLANEPTKINADPMGGGWLFKLKLEDATELDGLMDEAAYQRLIEGLGASSPWRS